MECVHALCGYLLPMSLSEFRTGYDFLYQSWDVSVNAFKWIRGSFGTRRKCSVCLQSFTRGHVLRCQLIQVKSMDYQAYLEVKNIYLTTAAAPKEHFTPLDFALNAKNYTLFMDYIKLLNSKLV
jgi:hypothetical protein